MEVKGGLSALFREMYIKDNLKAFGSKCGLFAKFSARYLEEASNVIGGIFMLFHEMYLIDTFKVLGSKRRYIFVTS